jgi:histidyl-tRNA synthetase
LDSLSQSSLRNLETLEKLLSHENVPVKINNKLVRGLDYYNGPCFEITPTTDSHRSMGTILAGGRYDMLADLIGSGGRGKYDVKSVG